MMILKKTGISIIAFILSITCIGHVFAASSLYYEYTNGKLKVIFSQKNNTNYKTEITYDANGNMLSKKVKAVGKVDAPAAVSYSKQSYDVYAIGVDSAAASVRFPTWNTPDGSAKWWYEGVKVAPGIWKGTIQFKNHNGGIGNYTTHVYVDDSPWGEASIAVSQNSSIQAPAQVSLADQQYEVVANNIDESVAMVRFPTWTVQDGQDDIRWTPGIRISPTSWKAIIKFSDYNYEVGTYTTHVYAYDRDNHAVAVSTTGGDVNVVSGIKAPLETSYSNVSYEILAYGIDPLATDVRFPTWHEQDGNTKAWWYQGEQVAPGVWKATILFNNHQGQLGNYETHIYVGDTYWGASTTTVKQTTTVTAPSQASLGDQQYTVVVNNVGKYAARVTFPTWTLNNDKDDIEWIEGTKISPTSWKATIRFSNHNYEPGIYRTDVYAYDNSNNAVPIINASIDINVAGGVKGPEKTSYSNASYEVFAYGVDPAAMEVRFPTWNEHDGSSSIWWYPGTKVASGVWKARIVFNNHPGRTGTYTTSVYVGDSYVGESMTRAVLDSTINAPTEVSLSKGKYDIVINNVGTSVTQVRFPTWTINNGQDDIEWKEGIKISPTSWKVTINLNNHSNELGYYRTDIYTYDQFGNISYFTLPDIKVIPA